MATLGLKNINLLSKEQYDTIAEPAIDELYAISGSGFGFPSDKFIDLTLGASGSSYTAPANGWVTLQTNAQSSSKFAFSSLGIPNSNLECTSHASSSNWSARVVLPVRRGQSFYAVYGDTDPNYTKFRFIYAEGEE